MVSIIIPNYNHAPYLEQRIDSVLGQTYKDFEIIILDDCSQDNSRTIIERYRGIETISHIIYNENNSGSVFRQWVKGIELSKGDYIWIAESDDFADATFLERVHKQICNNDKIGLVFTNSYQVDKKGKILGHLSDRKTASFALLKESDNVINHENFITFLLTDMIIENASSALFRKEIFKNIDFEFLRNFTNTGDRFVYIGIALNWNIKYLTESLNFMRKHENNLTAGGYINGKIFVDRLECLFYYINKIENTPINRKNLIIFLKDNFLKFLKFSSNNRAVELVSVLKKQGFINYRIYIFMKIYVFMHKSFIKNLKLNRFMDFVFIKFL